MKRILVVSTTVIGLTVALLVQTHAQNRVTSIPSGGTPLVADRDVNGPVPRLPDGHPDLTRAVARWRLERRHRTRRRVEAGELPLLPWAKELQGQAQGAGRTVRRVPADERAAHEPVSVEDGLQPDAAKASLRFTSSTNSATRARIASIYMDGRKHPDDLFPTWYGHSIGRWEGDTLVIDTVGYNDKFWFDSRGTPHTEKLHTIERFSRPNFGTLINEFTLDDPGAYSKTVQLKFTARRVRQDVELMEDICTENNQAGIAGGYRLNTANRDKEGAAMRTKLGMLAAGLGVFCLTDAGPRPSRIRHGVRREQEVHAHGRRAESGMAEPAHAGVRRRHRSTRAR